MSEMEELPQPLGKGVVVFIMDEQENFPVLVGQVKEFFNEQENLKIYAGRGEVAQAVIDIFAPLEAPSEAPAPD